MTTVARMIRGAVTIPARVRRELGLEDGAIVGFEVLNGMIIIRRVRIVPVDGNMPESGSNGRSRKKLREAVQPAGV